MTKSTLSRELEGVFVFFCSEVMVVWRQSNKIDGTVFNRFVRGCSHLLTLGSRGYFFLLTLMVRGETASTRREAPRGAFSNRKQGLFHIRYFENHLLRSKHVMRALCIATIT